MYFSFVFCIYLGNCFRVTSGQFCKIIRKCLWYFFFWRSFRKLELFPTIFLEFFSDFYQQCFEAFFDFDSFEIPEINSEPKSLLNLCFWNINFVNSVGKSSGESCGSFFIDSFGKNHCSFSGMVFGISSHNSFENVITIFLKFFKFLNNISSNLLGSSSAIPLGFP